MRKNFKASAFSLSYSTLFLFLLVSVLVSTGCEKETNTDDDLVGNWKHRPEFEGVGRTEAVLFTIGNKVYVGGGYDGDERRQDFWAFDQATGNWSPIASFPGTPRNSAVAFSINGKGYLGTGIDENDDKLKDFWEYDPANDTWTRKADFGGTARYNALGFSVGAKGYIGTGYDGSYLRDLWEYTPGAGASDPGSWTQKTSLTGSKRTEAVVFVHNNLAYVVTGFNNGTYLNDFWVYDPANDIWNEKRKISSVNDDEDYDDDYGDNIRRSNATAFVMDDKAYVTCGSRNGITNTTWEYNIATDTWLQKTQFEGAGRQGALGFVVQNRGYLVTGSNSSYYFDDLWEFFPSHEQDDNDNE